MWSLVLTEQPCIQVKTEASEISFPLKTTNKLIRLFESAALMGKKRISSDR